MTETTEIPSEIPADSPPSPESRRRYPLAARAVAGVDTAVAIGGGRDVVVGGRELVVIAGPCAVEGREMLRATAGAVRAAGAGALRGGAYKPRTSPYAFQGMGDGALELLAESRAETGLAIVTEVTDPRQVERVAEVADVLQVGTRNMHNVPLLAEVGQSGRPVLLKRGFSARIEEFLLAAEYVMAAGNRDVILCERGIRTFETATRNTLDIAAVPVLKAETHLPVLVDPSHAGGRSELVAPLSFAAVAAGADGLIIEVHPEGAYALSDGEQSITPTAFAELMATLRVFAAAAGRSVADPPVDGEVDAGDDPELAAVRGLIAETDRAIVDLARRRVELARVAGHVKRNRGLPVLDAAREREVERLMLEHGRDVGLADHHVHSIARALIALARTAQGEEDAR